MNDPINILLLSRLAQLPNRRTDRLFSLEGASGDPPRGLDVISPAGDRYFLTTAFPDSNYELITRHLGVDAILPYVGDEEGAIAIYKVPRGAISLRAALDRPRFDWRHMETMYRRAMALLRELQDLDPESFGVTLDNLALSYSGVVDGAANDVAYLSIVPPLAGHTNR